MNQAFWEKLDELVSTGEIVIDRPKDSRHPRYSHIVYPLDYGYLRDTRSMDGGGIDVWIGSRAERRVEAVICTVDMIKRDSEIKLLVGCTGEEMKIAEAFHNGSEFMKGLLIRRT